MQRLMTERPLEPFLGSIDKQRECRRRLVRAQADALRAAGMPETADRFERLALAEIAIVSRCERCWLELIGNDDCPRCEPANLEDYEGAAV